ncbi:MAG: hypothetical protein ACREF4_05590 [Gammaproteobacteria bacterium]
MDHIRLSLNPDSSLHEELVRRLREQLSALSTITVREEKAPAGRGTLVPGLDVVVAFVIEHPDKVVAVATSVINLVSVIVGRSGKRDASRLDGKARADTPAKLEADGQHLSLPASKESERRFLSALGRGARPAKQAKAVSHAKKPSEKRRDKKVGVRRQRSGK